MRFDFNTLPFVLSCIVILLCAPISAVAVRTSFRETVQLPPIQPHRSNNPSAHKSHSVFPQLTWLRNTAIEKVFGIPSKFDKTALDNPSRNGRLSSSQLPATLLAKYGGDVVLRFNISTSEEESALSEAADTLFLDVWEFADSWADIRLREDDVCMMSNFVHSINKL